MPVLVWCWTRHNLGREHLCTRHGGNVQAIKPDENMWGGPPSRIADLLQRDSWKEVPRGCHASSRVGPQGPRWKQTVHLIGQSNSLNNPKVIAWIIQLLIVCLEAGSPFLGNPKHTNNCSDLLQWEDFWIKIFNALTRQRRWSLSSSADTWGGGWKAWRTTATLDGTLGT